MAGRILGWVPWIAIITLIVTWLGWYNIKKVGEDIGSGLAEATSGLQTPGWISAIAPSKNAPPLSIDIANVVACWKTPSDTPTAAVTVKKAGTPGVDLRWEVNSSTGNPQLFFYVTARSRKELKEIEPRC